MIRRVLSALFGKPDPRAGHADAAIAESLHLLSAEAQIIADQYAAHVKALIAREAEE